MTTSSFFDDQHSAEQLPLPLWFRMLRRWEVTRTEQAAALLPDGASLLDIGCGEGELVARVGDRFPRITATDVSATVIATARERVRPQALAARVDWRVLDGNQRFPFEDAEFDLVVSLSTLQYIFDPEAFLVEAYRVIRPGGHLLMEVPNVAYLPQRLRLLLGRPIRTSFWKRGIDGGNLHYFTLATLYELTKQAGFRPLRHAGSGVFAAVRTWRVSLLCGNIFLLARRPD